MDTELIDAEELLLTTRTTASSGRRLRRVGNRVGWLGLRAAFFAAFCELWEVAADHRWISLLFFSKPSLIWHFLVNYFSSGDFREPLQTTVEESVLAFVIGSGLGIVAAVVLVKLPRLRKLLSPFLTGFNALPRVALAPLFILWFGIGTSSKVYLGVSLVFFIVMINTEAGIRSVEREYVNVAVTFGANAWDVFRIVTVPSIIPSVFSGLRVGLIYALLGVVTAEMIAARTGLGQEVVYYSSLFNTAGVLGILFLLAIVALVINETMEAIERHFTAWRRHGYNI